MIEILLPAISQGVVEGLTEFIPVSSTGHLILFGHLIEFKRASAHTFQIFIQLGAILAVVLLYWKRFTGLCDFSESGLQERTSFRGYTGLAKLAIACLPAFIFGFLLHDLITTLLFSPVPVALALVVGGVIMIFVEES